MGQSDRAVFALQPLAARPAHHDKRIAAAVEQDDGLLAARERGLGLRNQTAREELLLPCLLKLLPHVDELDFRQRPLVYALRHLDQRVAAALGVVPALERRRGRTQHHRRFGQLGSHDRHIARVIARILLLLVGGVVLLIDDDQAEPRHRRKDRRARPDHDARLAPRGYGATAPRALPASARNEASRPRRQMRECSCAAVAGVRPISGTSRMAERSRSSARCIAAMYTAVLPDPVTP